MLSQRTVRGVTAVAQQVQRFEACDLDAPVSHFYAAADVDWVAIVRRDGHTLGQDAPLSCVSVLAPQGNSENPDLPAAGERVGDLVSVVLSEH
jgi:hypothetical protein